MKVSNNKKIILISVVCGLACALCVFMYMQSVKTNAENVRNAALARYGGEQIEVCVAKRDIAAGETLDSTCFEMKMWLTDLLCDDAVRNSNEIIGKQVTSSIVSGEVISNKRFQDLSVSLEVPAGLSAVSVPAKDVSAVGGALKAGMHIDVYATGNTSTTLIARSVLVLATSASFNSSSTSSSITWITLAVNPSSVQELVAASQGSTLYFVLPSQDQDFSEDSSDSNFDSSSNKNLSNENKNSLEDKEIEEKPNENKSSSSGTSETNK